MRLRPTKDTTVIGVMIPVTLLALTALALILLNQARAAQIIEQLPRWVFG